MHPIATGARLVGSAVGGGSYVKSYPGAPGARLPSWRPDEVAVSIAGVREPVGSGGPRLSVVTHALPLLAAAALVGVSAARFLFTNAPGFHLSPPLPAAALDSWLSRARQSS